MPHKVDVEADTPWSESGADCEISFKDDTTDDELDVSYDQTWQHFNFSDGRANSTFEINPDGTFMVDGKGAASVKDALTLLEADPVIAKVSRYSLAMLVARIGRLAPPATRCAPTRTGFLDNDASFAHRVHYRILAVTEDDQARAYVVADAVLKVLLRGGTAPTSAQ